MAPQLNVGVGTDCIGACASADRAELILDACQERRCKALGSVT
jgi:hypothetical protein